MVCARGFQFEIYILIFPLTVLLCKERRENPSSAWLPAPFRADGQMRVIECLGFNLQFKNNLKSS
jgi:hypothetical protein